MNSYLMQYRNRLRLIVPVILMMLLLAGISIGAYHSSHECANPDTCAICTFQAASYTLSIDTTPGSDRHDEPVLLSIITLPERVSEPFQTSVFASHAPPQFC